MNEKIFLRLMAHGYSEKKVNQLLATKSENELADLLAQPPIAGMDRDETKRMEKFLRRSISSTKAGLEYVKRQDLRIPTQENFQQNAIKAGEYEINYFVLTSVMGYPDELANHILIRKASPFEAVLQHTRYLQAQGFSHDNIARIASNHGGRANLQAVAELTPQLMKLGFGPFLITIMASHSGGHNNLSLVADPNYAQQLKDSGKSCVQIAYCFTERGVGGRNKFRELIDLPIVIADKKKRSKPNDDALTQTKKAKIAHPAPKQRRHAANHPEYKHADVPAELKYSDGPHHLFAAQRLVASANNEEQLRLQRNVDEQLEVARTLSSLSIPRVRPA